MSDQSPAPDAADFDTLAAEFAAVFAKKRPDGEPAWSQAELDRAYPLLLLKAVSLGGVECLSDEQRGDLSVALLAMGADADADEAELEAAVTEYLREVEVNPALLDELEQVLVRHGERLSHDRTERAGEAFGELTGKKREKTAPRHDEEKPEGASSPKDLELSGTGRIRM